MSNLQRTETIAMQSFLSSSNSAHLQTGLNGTKPLVFQVILKFIYFSVFLRPVPTEYYSSDLFHFSREDLLFFLYSTIICNYFLEHY